MVQSKKRAKTFCLSVIVLVVMLATAAAVLAQVGSEGGASISEGHGAAPQGQGHDLLELGKQLNRQCALCHGLHSQGILGGKYPRLAGLPEYYQIKALTKC